jgi:oxygen-dependent protoporphyrinogen oxidase
VPRNGRSERGVKIAVIGAGIAGLAAAHRLLPEHDVVVLERDAIAGGKIRSQHSGEYVFEWGPAGFLSSAEELRALVHDAGLDDALVAAGPAAKKRYIFWNGTLHEIPAKPPALLGMSLLSPAGKLRAAGDLVIPKRTAAPDAADESIFAFMQRRFGREVAERIVAPVVLGVSGGDARDTSVAAVFPKLPEIERANGSVIRGMIAGTRTAAQMYTFAGGGMQRLTARLAEILGERVHYGAPVTRIERDGAGWRVVRDGGDVFADGVIVATPAGSAAALTAGLDPALATELRAIPYAPMRVAGIAFRAADVAAPLDGFGFLAARGSGVRILGAVYTSTIAPDQAPAGTKYLRVFLGGAADAAAVQLDADAVRAIVRTDLATALGITAEPVAFHDVSWPQAIPHYTLAHRARVRAIETRAAAHPHLALIGNAYRGLGVGDTVRDARAVAAAF